MLPRNNNLKFLARKLRNEMSKVEIIFWSKIKNKQLGLKFNRQKVIGNYIVDFYCHEKKLIIEIDGDQHHLTKEDELKDKIRDNYLKSLGLKILRFSSTEVYNNINGVLNTIWEEINPS